MEQIDFMISLITYAYYISEIHLFSIHTLYIRIVEIYYGFI